MNATEWMKKKILMIDNDSELLDAWKFRLGQKGYEVQTIISPFEALRILQEKEFDLVITDYRIPFMVMDGCKLSQEIKMKINIPVILYSSLDSIDCAYADAFVSKGETPNTLIAKIKELLEKS